MPGAGSQLALGKITAEHIDDIFDTNVKGSIFTVQKALPLMGRRFDHPDRIERRHHGRPGIQRLQREQGGSAQPRTDLSLVLTLIGRAVELGRIKVSMPADGNSSRAPPCLSRPKSAGDTSGRGPDEAKRSLNAPHGPS